MLNTVIVRGSFLVLRLACDQKGKKIGILRRKWSFRFSAKKVEYTNPTGVEF